MWECMIISLKAGLGAILWGLVSLIVFGSLGAIASWLDKTPKKPKYDGQPIVHDGGKKNE